MMSTLPIPPLTLGPRLTGLKVLLYGTCQLEPLVSVAPRLGYVVNHMLMSSHQRPSLSAVDLAATDAVVIGFSLRHVLRIGAGKPDSLAGDTILARIGDATEAAELIASCGRLIAELVQLVSDDLKGIPTFFLAFLEPSFSYGGSLGNRYARNSPRYVVQRLNEILNEELLRYPGFHFLDSNEILDFVGRMHIQDDVICASSHASFIGGFDFSNDAGRLVAPRSVDLSYNSGHYKELFGEALWNRVADSLKILRQSNPVKLIIVDLDDTLWRGVAAEDSLANHKRVEGWPLGFVESLLYYKGRGGLLAICSKNDLEPTLARLGAIWQGAIRQDDFVSIRIDWRPKSENIAEILAEVNLLPENTVFIDDNPREIDEVQSRFPQLRCLGADHMDWRRIILMSPETQVPFVTSESQARTQLVRALVERRESAKEMPRSQWLESLNLRQRLIVIKETSSEYFTRGLELLNKTNQFNTTGKRWSIEEIEDFFSSGGIWVLTALKDKTVDNGIIGLALVIDDEITQVVLSCRVFDLGAEIALGSFATTLALRKTGVARARIVDTGKNFTCHKFFSSIGFVADGDWFRASNAWPMPSWITVTSATDPGWHALIG